LRVRPRQREIWGLTGAVLLGLLLPNCAKVDSAADYRRGAELISARTGAADIYDPNTDTEIDSRTTLLLADGLTVNKAVQIALLRNRDFQRVFTDIGVARAELVQAGLFTNPVLSLGGFLPDAGGRAKLAVGLAQQIADLWQIPIRKHIAEFALEQAVLTAGQRGITLAARVQHAYYVVVALEQAEQYARENTAQFRRALELAERQQTAGEASPADVQLAQAGLLQARADELAARGLLEQARADLAYALGLSRWPATWTLTDALPATPAALPSDPDLLERAGDQRLDAQIAELQVNAAEEEVVYQLARIFPNLTVGLALERKEARAPPGRKIWADLARTSIAHGELTAPTITSRGQRDLAQAQAIDAVIGPTLSLTLPLWDQNQAQIARARLHLLEARQQREGVLDTVAHDVQHAAAAVRTTGELMRFYQQESLPQVEGMIALALRRYELGEESLLVLIDAEEQWVRRRRTYIDILREHALAVAALEAALGGRIADLAAPSDASTQPAPPEEGQ
jgi:outer membrane protein, heavy metal efflux system